MFPVLDVLRIGVKTQAVSATFCQSPSFLAYLLQQLQPSAPPANSMLALRILTNLFSQPEGVTFLTQNNTQIMEAVTSCSSVSTKNAQIAQSSVVLNYAVNATKTQDFENKSSCIQAAARLVKAEGVDGEATFRLLVALGTMVHGDEMSRAVFQSLNITDTLRLVKDRAQVNKVSDVAAMLIAL